MCLLRSIPCQLFFMATMVQHKSSTEIPSWPSGASTSYPFWVAGCWDCSWSCLLLSVSLRSSSWPNLQKTFPELLLASWLGWVLPALAFTPLEVNMWEHVTSISGFTPVYWVLTTIGFPPVCCVCSALGFLPLHWVLEAFGFSPNCCEVEACHPLITLFLLVLAKIESWGERSALWRCLSFVYQDL